MLGARARVTRRRLRGRVSKELRVSYGPIVGTREPCQGCMEGSVGHAQSKNQHLNKSLPKGDLGRSGTFWRKPAQVPRYEQQQREEPTWQRDQTGGLGTSRPRV